MKRIIIWGHKLHRHTHSYIHNSYYKAFKYLGYDVYWFDNSDDISNFNFENSIFLTEGQVDQKIPMIKSSYYILHHCNNEKYQNFNYINLCNYVNNCKIGISHNYKNSTVEKINYYTYYDSNNKAIYQPWATDLLTNEIELKISPLISTNNIYFIGSVWSDNYQSVSEFIKSCELNDKKFIPIKGTSDLENKNYVRESYISFDIRTDLHLDVGYIPCRIFKNISYGCIPSTHSKFIRDFFGDNLLPYSNIDNLITNNREFRENSKNIDISLFLINEVKENHTYVNRINEILKLI
jgi:hypothetical protein